MSRLRVGQTILFGASASNNHSASLARSGLIPRPFFAAVDRVLWWGGGMGYWECPRCGSNEQPYWFVDVYNKTPMTREVLDLQDSGYDISRVIKCVNCQQSLKEENYTPTDEDSKALLKLKFMIVILCVLLCITTALIFQFIPPVVAAKTKMQMLFVIMFFLGIAAAFLCVKTKVSGTNGVVKRYLETEKMAKRSYKDWMEKTNKKD